MGATPWQGDACGLVEEFRAGRRSPVEELRATYDAIDASGLNAFCHLPRDAAEAFQAWYATTPDTPCIAICSTSQGDEMCKGCGRTFEEVQLWTEMSAGEKRAVWHRITQEGTSWRFNKYAERAAEDRLQARAAAEAQTLLPL